MVQWRALVELRPGAVLANKLALLHPLGQGGMGVVWAAHHLALDTDVAVKFIRPERVAADPTLVARFEREARATARIAHPHVVRIMDYGTVDEVVPYIVMELLPGFSLAELLEQGGRLSFATAKVLLQQVGSALECAHESGIVHRDIKPHNLFITAGGGDSPLFVRVLDFGVAKMLKPAHVHNTSATLTEAGVVVGSAAYMSPEQLEASRHVDLRSDLWSLAVILYEVLTGTLPFQGSSFVSIGAAVLRGEFALPSERRPDLPKGTDEWFSRALSVDPNGRFQTVREMLDAFPGSEPATKLVLSTESSHREPSGETSDSLQVSRTLEHPPIARPTRRSWFRGEPPGRRLLLLGAVAGVTAVVGVGLSRWARTAVLVDCPPGMTLVRGGTFGLGSIADADTPSDETTAEGRELRVTLSAFCIDTTEVTVEAYRQCTSCKKAPMTVEYEGLTPKGRDIESGFCNGSDFPSHPMNCVDWYAAQSYCAAVGKRLPTEAEWELAARGTTGRRYPWGETQPSGKYLNACDTECSRVLTERLYNAGRGPWPKMFDETDWAASTAPVGHYPAGATPEGVLDLAGNVWEWTDSPYCPYPYDGPDGCGDFRRVLRGGGWDTTDSQNARSARRYPSVPTARGKSVGFRCAKTL